MDWGGAKSTRYFLGLEKSRQVNNKIESLRDTSGKVCKSDKDILGDACSFYETLYTSTITEQGRRQQDLNNYFSCLPDNCRLTDNNKMNCDSGITVEECLLAVSKMKKNISPGLDGLSVDFLQTVWHVLLNCLVIYTMKVIIQSMEDSVTAMIHKQEDTEEIANYIPISLTNVDDRILACIMANEYKRLWETLYVVTRQSTLQEDIWAQA